MGETVTGASTEYTPPKIQLTNKKEVIKLSKKMLTEDKNGGLTNPEIAKKYNLPVTQVTKALKMVGLYKVKARTRNKFEIVED